jgi:uncharacterized Fe-S cluster-containing radical SAM superfamily protein
MKRPPNVSEKAAPYMRKRPTAFYPEFGNGTYTLDIAGCNWTCEHCWSGYGWKGKEPAMWWEPEEAATHAIEGMKRNAQTVARISGGEISLYWDHFYEFARIFLERTDGVVFHVPGLTEDEGNVLGLLIETNGSLMTPDKLKQLDELGDPAYRLLINFGLKSTHVEGLQELTGMSMETAERMHYAQYENYFYAIEECKRLDVMASLLDKFTEPELVAKMERRVERSFPGAAANIGILPYKRYPTKTYYTPKRFRWGQFMDEGAAVDEEVILSIVDEEGTPPSVELLVNEWEMTEDEAEARALSATEPSPTKPDEDDVAIQREFYESVAEAPNGRFAK